MTAETMTWNNIHCFPSIIACNGSTNVAIWKQSANNEKATAINRPWFLQLVNSAEKSEWLYDKRVSSSMGNIFWNSVIHFKKGYIHWGFFLQWIIGIIYYMELTQNIISKIQILNKYPILREVLKDICVEPTTLYIYFVCHIRSQFARQCNENNMFKLSYCIWLYPL